MSAVYKSIPSLAPYPASPPVASATPRLRPLAGQPGLAIDVRGLGKSYGQRQVLQGIDLHIARGEFVAIVGRSGCGKSTLLRLLAGLELPSSGSIHLDGEPLRPQATSEQGARLMFQDARLLPWKRVAENVGLGLAHSDGSDARQRVHDALAAVGLADRARDWPAALSGGQRQRVALARALIHRPRLLLLDEPLGALDALTRIEMHQLIEGLWRQQGFTAVLVTHDVTEAVALADRVLLIEDHAVALDQRIALPHPRERGDAAFASLEDRILKRVLQHPDDGDSGPATQPPLALGALRWAV